MLDAQFEIPAHPQDIFQFMSTQLVTNLKAAANAVKPLQPSRGRSNTDTQLPLASQRITDVPYYTEYYYLLENLATIRSVVLALDVPDADDIVTSFFTGFVDVVR
jgi:sister-chromatid-cohesion protein PDS5